MMHKLSKLVPVGVKITPVLLASGIGLALCIISSVISFHWEFIGDLNRISKIDMYGNRIFLEGEKMEAYKGAESFFAFELFFLCLAAFALYCFIYHYIGAKSIYTMRRLKNPLELSVRCLSIPVIFILTGIALIYLMNYSFIKFYLYYVPEENLWSMWDKNLWEVLR